MTEQTGWDKRLNIDLKQKLPSYLQSILIWSEALPTRGHWSGAEIESNISKLTNPFGEDNLLVLSGLTGLGRNLWKQTLSYTQILSVSHTHTWLCTPHEDPSFGIFTPLSLSLKLTAAVAKPKPSRSHL